MISLSCYANLGSVFAALNHRYSVSLCFYQCDLWVAVCSGDSSHDSYVNHGKVDTTNKTRSYFINKALMLFNKLALYIEIMSKMSQ